jgi:hypothetical protein
MPRDYHLLLYLIILPHCVKILTSLNLLFIFRLLLIRMPGRCLRPNHDWHALIIDSQLRMHHRLVRGRGMLVHHHGGVLSKHPAHILYGKGRSHLDVRLRVFDNEVVNELVQLHLVHSEFVLLKHCLLHWGFGRGDNFRLLLIVLSAHGQIVHAVVELGREETVLIQKTLMTFLGQVFLQLVLVVDQFLFPLDVFEHVLRLREDHIVGEYLRVFVVESAQLRQTGFDFCLVILTLEELIDVVKY